MADDVVTVIRRSTCDRDGTLTVRGDRLWCARCGDRAAIELRHVLLRTPGYVTWQGEQWQFCCRRPSIYLGEWKEEEFERHAPNGDGRTLFLQADIEGLDKDAWGELRRIGGPYVYRCPACRRLLGHYDLD